MKLLVISQCAIAAALIVSSTGLSQTTPAPTGTAILSWVPPATYADSTTAKPDPIAAGTAITYNVYVYCGTGGDPFPGWCQISTKVATPTFTVTALPVSVSPNCPTWKVSAVVNGVESAASNTVSKCIPATAPPAPVVTVKPVPNAPTNATVK